MMPVTESQQGANERRLLQRLFNASDYNKLERPVADENDPLVVTLSLVIQQIMDVVRLLVNTLVINETLDVVGCGPLSIKAIPGI